MPIWKLGFTTRDLEKLGTPSKLVRKRVRGSTNSSPPVLTGMSETGGFSVSTHFCFPPGQRKERGPGATAKSGAAPGPNFSSISPSFFLPKPAPTPPFGVSSVRPTFGFSSVSGFLRCRILQCRKMQGSRKMQYCRMQGSCKDRARKSVARKLQAQQKPCHKSILRTLACFLL